MEMKIFSLLQKKCSGDNYTQDYATYSPNMYNSDNNFYLEEHFADFLQLERKRSERSRRPFILMVIGLKEFSKAYELHEIAQDIARLLFSTTRATDIKGWYKHNKEIGIIFNEISSEGQGFQVVQQHTLNKIQRNLMEYLGVARFDKLVLSYQIFPGDFMVLSKTGRPSDKNQHQDLVPPPPIKRISLVIKRLVDIIGSLCAIIFFIPVFLIVAALIKLTSPGNIFFKQERVGLHGKKFMFLKFRSMYRDNDPTIHKEFVRNLIQGGKNSKNSGNGNQNKEYKIKNDPRVTQIGAFLRKTSLDELPQFFNVLKGEMSLVGPRPPIPYECQEYDIWHRRRVLEMKPGITGLWQVDGRSATAFDDMVRIDIRYIREWSLLLDFKILIKTPLVVLTCKGAY